MPALQNYVCNRPLQMICVELAYFLKLLFPCMAAAHIRHHRICCVFRGELSRISFLLPVQVTLLASSPAATFSAGLAAVAEFGLASSLLSSFLARLGVGSSIPSSSPFACTEICYEQMLLLQPSKTSCHDTYKVQMTWTGALVVGVPWMAYALLQHSDSYSCV